MTVRKAYQRTSSGWSDERRARHSAAIRTWSPWTRSTGPRTEMGKSVSRCNALKHGATSRPVKNFMRNLQTYRQFLALCFDRRKSLAEMRGEPQRQQFRGEHYRPKIHRNVQNELLNIRQPQTTQTRQATLFPNTYMVHFAIPTVSSPVSASFSPPASDILCKQFAFSLTYAYIARHESAP